MSSDPNNDNVNGHGTKVSGIIGAIRNNTTGIAGIAGGSGSADGVRLIGLKTGLSASSLSNIVEALSDAVDDYNAQVINCSFGFSPYEYPVESAEMREKLHYVNRMGAIVCAGRGNIGQSGGNTAPVVPGTSQDEWVLCVGGTSSAGNYSNVAKHGNVIDVAAPAESTIVPTIGNTADNAYTTFSGTSSSTAHASGAAALLAGYALPTQLVQEDIEYILQASATDVDVPPAGAGYDGYTGHGRIDVGAAIAMIDKEHCVVSHFGTDVNANTKNSELIEENITLYIGDNFTTEDGQTFDAGSYTADVYKVTASVTHSLPPGYSITDYWERHSSSTVFKYYITNPNTGSKSLQPVEHVTITGTPTSTTATLEGYVYYLKNGNCSVEGWIPATPQAAELTYSLIACDGTVDTDEAVSEPLIIAPNPVSGQLTVTIPDNGTGSYFSLSVYDLAGKEVLSIKDLAKWNGGKSFQLDVSELPQGIYSLTLISKSAVFSSKFIKI